MFPDFLCIGAHKAGTTWLYGMLKAHPGIWMPPVKEIHYFDKAGEGPKERYHIDCGVVGQGLPNEIGTKDSSLRIKNCFKNPSRMVKELLEERRIMWKPHVRQRLKSYLRNPFRLGHELMWDWIYFLGRPSDRWYASLFKNEGGKISGDISPSYAVLSAEKIRYVHELIADIKIIFMLRNPIERSWSAARMFSQEGRLDLNSDQGVLAFLSNERVIHSSDYIRTLREWGEYFSESRIFIGFFEEIAESPEAFLIRVYRFLNVDKNIKYIPKHVKKIVLPGPDIPIPGKVAAFLARQQYKKLKEIEARFGGYTTRWLESAEGLIH